MTKTYNDLYLATRTALQNAGVEAYALEARLLVAYAVGKTKEEFVRDLRLYTSDENEQKIAALLQRRIAGEPLAYLIAPPVPALLGLDAALKAAGVELAEFYAPPTETNFAGALRTGTRSACLAACTAFAEAVCEAAARPLEAEGTRRNAHGI